MELAYLYNRIGNEELRDEAIERALAKGVGDEWLVSLRRLQGRIGDIPTERVEAALAAMTAEGAYRSRSFVYEDLGRYRDAAETYVRGLAADLGSLKTFTIARHLAELAESGVIEGLLVESLKEAAEREDLWWQVRALEQLGWTSELHALVLEHEDDIDVREDLREYQRFHLHSIVAKARQDQEAYREARTAMQRIRARWARP